MSFVKLLQGQWKAGKFVCVGLDSDVKQIPEFILGSPFQRIREFNCSIIDATKDLACAYKPNIAFYERFGETGWGVLRMTIDYIREVAPGVPVILDAKRADIGNTNLGYVEASFEDLGADAITVNPYFGAEALQPFLDQKDKGIIVLCRTSNLGAKEFQDLLVNGEPLYCVVARQVANEWNKNGNCAVVVGATWPEELQRVRQIIGDIPILIPGIGFQQKDVPIEKQVEQTVAAGKDSHGQGMIINSARGIIFASRHADYPDAARAETLKLHNLINQFRT